MDWLEKLGNDSISQKARAIHATKESLNKLLTHANPLYNLVFASGFDLSDKSRIFAWYVDAENSQMLRNYVFLLWSFLELVEFISIISPLTRWKTYLSSTFREIPDFHLEKYLEKYTPDLLY